MSHSFTQLNVFLFHSDTVNICQHSYSSILMIIISFSSMLWIVMCCSFLQYITITIRCGSYYSNCGIHHCIQLKSFNFLFWEPEIWRILQEWPFYFLAQIFGLFNVGQLSKAALMAVQLTNQCPWLVTKLKDFKRLVEELLVEELSDDWKWASHRWHTLYLVSSFDNLCSPIGAKLKDFAAL